MKNITLLELAYPCITYVLKRTGIFLSIDDILNAPVQKMPISNFVEGDIIV